ncbi:hypothetical protein G6F56_009285 [Rhizopus delemar]|nr:hypothetical protein G6F56_009285 [Rhizopus delemar]
MNYHILGSKSFEEAKETIWDKILKMKYKALKKQKADKTLCFYGTILTDGVTAIVLKQNFESERRRKDNASSTSSQPEKSSSNNVGNSKKPKSKKSLKDVEEFPYIESLTREQLKEIEGKSTVKILRNKLKPESIKLAELQLSRFPSATLNSEQFVQYPEARRHVGEQLKNYYSNETLEETIVYQSDPLDFIVEKSGDIYYGKHLLFITRLRGAPSGIANLDAHICYLTLILSNKHLTQRLTNQDTENLNRIIEDTTIWMNKERPPEEELVVKLIQDKQQTHLIIARLLVLPFRRLKFVSKIYYDKCDLKLVKDLRRKFGNDLMLVVGDWSAPNAKF